jgi:hypothetical protein
LGGLHSPGELVLCATQHTLFCLPTELSDKQMKIVFNTKQIVGTEELKFLGHKWFPPAEANQLRDTIEEFIVREFQKNLAGNTSQVHTQL